MNSDPALSATRTSGTTWLALAALLGWTGLLAFTGLDAGARFEPTDAWVAQTAREMYECGDWLVPRFSGEIRMQKSPGPYWAVMATAWLRGTPIDEAAARIPNAIAAVLLVLTVFLFTRAIAGERAAIFAGFAASSSTLVLYWSHRGASDLGLTTLMAISLAALWCAFNAAQRAPARVGLLLLGYFAAGLAMVYKMPMPLVCIGLPAVGYVLFCRRWGVLANPWHLVGFVLFLAPWVPWVVAILRFEPVALAKWRVEFWDRMTGDLPNVAEQMSPWFYLFYFQPLVVFTLPYTFSLPGALRRAIFPQEDGRYRDGVRFCLIWATVLFAFFTLSVGKESRYFLPALPPLFVLLGIELAALFDPTRQRSALELRVARLLSLLVPVLLVVGGIVAAEMWQRAHGRHQGVERFDLHVRVQVAMLLFSASAILAVALYRRARTNEAFAALVGGMYATWLWAWAAVLPVLVSQTPFLDFAAQMREVLTPERLTNTYQIAQQDPRVIWYADRRFPRVVDQLKLLAEQNYRRDRDVERRIISEQALRLLGGTEPAFLVLNRFDYVAFVEELSRQPREQRPALPPHYIWCQTRVGPQSRHCLLIGNRPPPPPHRPLALEPPSARVEAALRELGSVSTSPPAAPPGGTATAPAASAPASQGAPHRP